MADLGTREGAALFFERRRAEVAREFIAKGELARPTAWIIARREPPTPSNVDRRTGLPKRPTPYLDTPEAVDCPMPAWLVKEIGIARAKQVFSESVRTYAKALEADGYIVLMEAWMTMHARADYKPGEHPLPVDDPNRREVLVAVVVHRELGEQAWLAEIEREPFGIKPWVKSDDDAEVAGKFTGRPL